MENFAGQWLELRKLKSATPAAKIFPDFDEKLRAAMHKETELFFETMLREDRNVLDFLDADFTFLNGRLARHYGIPGVTGEPFQRVSLTGSLRQRMEQHRANPSCASCHARMDPIGFGFENFDGIGAWREKEGEFPIDPAGVLVSGESLHGPADLKIIPWNQKKNEFVRCLTEKMLTYALGRRMEYYDKCALDEIAKNVVKKKYTFSSLILEVVRSAPFRMKRGAEDPLSQVSP